MSPRISVIVPTLQRADELPDLVRRCSNHPLVGEIIVVNNASEPLPFSAPKLRALNQPENIYVNPAWNLGVRESRYPLIAVVNDDVLFDTRVFGYCAKVLSRGRTGILGADTGYANRRRDRIRSRPATFDHIWHNFGMFMCLRREDWVPIPEELRIWGGDEWLFVQQKRPNRVILGAGFETETNVTSSSQEFQAMRRAENQRTRELVDPLWGTRWWHRPTTLLSHARTTRAKIRRAMARHGRPLVRELESFTRRVWFRR